MTMTGNGRTPEDTFIISSPYEPKGSGELTESYSILDPFLFAFSLNTT